MAGYLEGVMGNIGDKQDIIFVGTGIILVRDDGKILMGRRTDNNQWCLPGGTLELGEGLEDCIIRETLEEVGITLDKNNLRLNSAKAILEPINKNGNIIHVVSISYRARYGGEEIRIDNEEFSKYDWFNVGMALNMGDITNYSRIALEEYKLNGGDRCEGR